MRRDAKALRWNEANVGTNIESPLGTLPAIHDGAQLLRCSTPGDRHLTKGVDARQRQSYVTKRSVLVVVDGNQGTWPSKEVGKVVWNR
jgi:hypothetical protein